MTSSGKKDYKEKHGMVICYVGYMWASDSIYFLVKLRRPQNLTKAKYLRWIFSNWLLSAFENFVNETIK